MEWLAKKLTDLCRPWHDDGLPEELAFGAIEAEWFVRGAMARAARMAVSLNVAFGVFAVIGIDHARRASRAWRPRERLLMEDVSRAFQPIGVRATAGRPVPRIQEDRLTFLLGRYLAYVGSPWPEDRLGEAVERFIEECPRGFPGEDGEDGPGSSWFAHRGRVGEL